MMMAVKAAAAGVGGWYVALLIPQASAYAYYAPFGAVMAMTFSIADSFRQIVRVLLAIAVGSGLAMASELLVPSDGAAVAIIIFIGISLGGLRLFGNVAVWVPMTAIFVLIIGSGNPDLYVSAYAGLTMLGGLIAAAVNVAVPPLPIASFDRLQTRVRERIADRMDDLATWTKDADDSARRSVMDHQVLVPLLSEIWSATNRTVDAQRINVRAKRYTQRIQRQYDDAERLERLVYLAQEIIELTAQVMGSDRSEFGASEDLRLQLGNTLEAYGSGLRWAQTGAKEQRQAIATTSRNLRGLRDAIPADDWLVTSALASIRRSAQILLPDGYACQRSDDNDQATDPTSKSSLGR